MRVWEANLDSESVLWLISRTGGVPPRVTVESTARPGDRIECSFDAEVGTITCAPGPAVHAPVRQFRWGGERFHCDGREYSVAAAAADILDELVCIDDE